VITDICEFGFCLDVKFDSGQSLKKFLNEAEITFIMTGTEPYEESGPVSQFEIEDCIGRTLSFRVSKYNQNREKATLTKMKIRMDGEEKHYKVAFLFDNSSKFYEIKESEKPACA